MLRTRVGFHQWSTYAGHPGRDGANLAYAEIVRVLQGHPRLLAVPHNLLELIESPAQARSMLGSVDVVVATVGAHAAIYHYLREVLDLEFRIIRDVRTALFTPYVLQEALAMPLLRDGDVVIHSSRYSAEVFRTIYSTAKFTSAVCYPLAKHFPVLPGTQKQKQKQKPCFVLGFVGRITEDKGFEDALRFVDSARSAGILTNLIAIGEDWDGLYARNLLEGRYRSLREYVQLRPPVEASAIWEFYSQLDAVLFPSTSSLETFGRVLAEASHAGVPVLAARHGASAELLQERSLMPVEYESDIWHGMHESVALGKWDVSKAGEYLQAIESQPLPNVSEQLRGDMANFERLVRESHTGSRPAIGGPGRLINIETKDFPTLSRDQAMSALQEFAILMKALHKWGSDEYRAAIGRICAAPSSDPVRTARFVDRSTTMGEDLSNIGGMEMQFANLIGFHPSYKVTGRPVE